jgi:hypothetical protein
MAEGASMTRAPLWTTQSWPLLATVGGLACARRTCRRRHRGLGDDAGIDNPYRTATGLERVYVSVDDLQRARDVAEAMRAPTGERLENELKVSYWRAIAVGGLIGAAVVAFLPHGVRLVALMVLIITALPWLLLKGHADQAPHRGAERDSGEDASSGAGLQISGEPS